MKKLLVTLIISLYPFPGISWKPPSDYLPLFDGKFPKFKSGSRVSYSNGGYVLLGIIIEKLTGQSYRDFMANEVFAQLGMLST